MSVFSIDDIGWGAPRVIQTRFGQRRIREWKIPPHSPFWDVWKTGHLRQQGYTVSMWKDDWMLTEWRLPDGSVSEQARRSTAGAESSDKMVRHNEEAEPELTLVLADRFREVEEIYDSIMDKTGQDFKYQLPSIKRLALAVEAYDGALDASDTGTGKTPVACAVAKTLGRKLFVVCPKAVITPWLRMAQMFDVEIDIINYEMLRTGKTRFGFWDPEKRRRFCYTIDQDDTLFVFDECHRMKGESTMNSALGVAAVLDGYKVLALSATAADNPMHMKFIGLLTDLIRHPSHFYGWLTQNGCSSGRWGMQFIGGRDVISRIHRQIFPVRGSRIRIAELGDRFPQTRIISEPYDLMNVDSELAKKAGVSGKDAKAAVQAVYDEMNAEIAKLEATRSRDRGANILTQILRARQRVELLKVPTLCQMAKDGLEEGMSVVMVLNFEDTVQAVAQRMDCENIIHGGDKPEHRQLVIDRFNDDDESLVIMNIRAGGLGIGLHGTAKGRPRLALISPTFSGIDLKQALGRVHRAGGARSIQKLCWAAGTIEEQICEAVKEKLQRVSVFNDNTLDQALAGLTVQQALPGMTT
jgi:superfamily II DNA or RNA helicase